MTRVFCARISWYTGRMKLLRKAGRSAFKGKTVLLRIDLNVEPGEPLDSYRLEAALPSIRFLLARGSKVVILSHRGRPKGGERRFSLAPFAPLLAKKLRIPIDFIHAARVGALNKAVSASRTRVALVENLRFFKGEEANDPGFAKALAALGDAYVNDAFAVSHRANASVAALARYLPSYAGLELEEEIVRLGEVMRRPARPFALIVGGAKIADKVGVIEYFWKRADFVLLGGGPANTFFAAEGVPMGGSLFDPSAFPFVAKYRDKGKIMLPVDSEIGGAKGDERILDIGEVTARWFGDLVKDSKAVVWNGPMGLFEKKGFEKGTVAIWRAVFALAKKDPRARIVVGGGETIASLQLLKTSARGGSASGGKNLFLSTGGGAMLEFLSGKKLPGIVALEGQRRKTLR